LLGSSIDWLSRDDNGALIRRGLRGVEKESLRVGRDGELSMRDHPRALGSALTHPYLTTDYSEALLEFVTPPHASNWETLQFLCDLHAFVHRHLGDELLWPASMPCIMSRDEQIPIARYGRSNAGLLRTVYRRGLGLRYGRAMQAIAGVHFNFSPPTALWRNYAEFAGSREPLASFKSASLMGLVRNYRRCAWLVIYLFGSSPAFCKSFRPKGHPLLSELDASTWFAPHATSLRMSDMGYRNSTQARLNISVNSLDEYVGGLTAAVTTPDESYAKFGVVVDGEFQQLNANILQIENEYYSSIRPKSASPSPRPIVALRREGVEYVEIRSLDLNLSDPVGINQAQMRLLEALLVRCLLVDSAPITGPEQAEIDARDLAVAREGRRPGLTLPHGGKTVALVDLGLELLEEVEQFAAVLDSGGNDYAEAVAAAKAAIREPALTPSARLLAALEHNRASFAEYVSGLAREHHDYFMSLPLTAAKSEFFARTAERSLAEAEALEAEDEVPFAEYVRLYSRTL
jgi:glutamate--cysteine ligase